MSEKRMFAKAIIDSDTFLDMPVSARLLYYDFGMRADDDGFVNAPKKIMKMTGATTDDMNVLIARKYIIPFDSGIIVIRHWRINNYLRSDRYKASTCIKEKGQLICSDGVYYTKEEEYYTLDSAEPLVGIPDGIPVGIPVVDVDKNSIDKNSIDKSSSTQKKPKKKFVPPTEQEVAEYVASRTNPGETHPVDPAYFISFYNTNGWVQGKSGKPIKSWKDCVITWEKRANYKFVPQPEPKEEPEEEKPSEAWQKFFEEE